MALVSVTATVTDSLGNQDQQVASFQVEEASGYDNIVTGATAGFTVPAGEVWKIGRASCRERV